MSQNTTTPPAQLTTSTNVKAAIDQALKSGNIAETLRFLLATGATPAQMVQAFGSIAHDVSILCAVEIADGKKFLREYEKLDPERRSEMDAETRAWIAAGKFKAHHKAEEPEAGSEHASKLGFELANAHTIEEKVHLVTNHFEHGGSIEDAAVALGATKEQAKKVKEIEEAAKEEFEQKHRQEKERMAEELRKRGFSEAEAKKRAEELYRAEQSRFATEQVVASGVLPPDSNKILDQASKEYVQKAKNTASGMSFDTVGMQTAPNKEAAKAELSQAARAVAEGRATTEQSMAFTAGALVQGDAKGVATAIKQDKALEDFSLKALMGKTDSAVGKQLGLAALATGAISGEKVADAKENELAGDKKGNGLASSDDEFASLGSPVVAASVDIKGKLAAMRNAEAPAPASKGPSLA